MKLPTSIRRNPRLLDRVEQVLLVLGYAWLLMRIWPGQLQPENWFSLLLLFSEGIVVFFMLIRRPRRRDRVFVQGQAPGPEQ